MSTITIVGAGLMGTALCWPLTDNGHRVRLTGTPLDTDLIEGVRKDRIHPTLQRAVPESVDTYTVDELETSLKGADWVIDGVSSFGVNWFADTVGPLLKPEQPVLAVTKGLEDQPNGDLLILPEVINRRLPEAAARTAEPERHRRTVHRRGSWPTATPPAWSSEGRTKRFLKDCKPTHRAAITMCGPRQT